MFRANLAENNGELDAMRDDVELARWTSSGRIGERWGLANTLRSKALLLTLDGDLDAAEAAYDEALELMAQLQVAGRRGVPARPHRRAGAAPRRRSRGPAR